MKFPLLSMGRTVCAALGLALAAVSALPALAQTESKPLDTQALTAIVEAAIGSKIESIAPAPVAGLYEVIFNGNIVYIDATGKYLVDGHLVEVESRSSVTARRKQEHEIATTPKMDVAQLDLADAIKTVYGKEVPGRVLVSFEDPRCPFCKRMHQTLSTMPDLVVYTFPVSFLGPESRNLNESIWCAANRSKAWSDAMEDKPAVRFGATCDLQALERNSALANKYRIAGTPTFFTPSGFRIAGAVDAAMVEEALRATP